MRKIHNVMMSLGLASLLLGIGCGAPEDQSTKPPVIPPENLGVPGEEEAFYHEEEVGDVFADGRQLPPSLAARMHACGKVRYATLGKILQSRGVNITNTAADSAGLLYSSGNLVLGVANYDARASEADRNTTGGIARLFDILIAEADEMIANMDKMPACTVEGVGAKLFDQNGCNADGFTCLLGTPVSAGQLSLCNDMVSDFGMDTAAGQRLAVAAMAASITLCD